MLHIETIDLQGRGVVLPWDRLGVVISQPFVELTSVEPFRCPAAAKAERLAGISATLDLAQNPTHGADRTHFTVFPEYSIPNVEGVNLIDQRLRSSAWPSQTVVIGGTDGIPKAEYRDLLTVGGTHVDGLRNGVEAVGDTEWINCGIIWVKSSNGTVERWIQPKLHPADPETGVLYQSMFCGKSVFVFKGQLANAAPFRFAILICFDWIATLGAHKSLRWLLGDIEQHANGSQIPLSWLFVIQHNKKPSHDTFLKEVDVFFDQTQCPNVLRDKASLLFVNTAGRSGPGPVKVFGATSVVLSQAAQFVMPQGGLTYSSGGKRFRDGSTLLQPYKDVFFRERGACIVSFAQHHPGSTVAGAGGRVVPVEKAELYPLSGPGEPRVPGGPVPACIKWAHDRLDEIQSLSTLYSTAALADQAGAVGKEQGKALRALAPQVVTRAVRMATPTCETDDADQWDRRESEALEHVVHSLNILGVGLAPLIIGADKCHGTMTMEGRAVDLIAVRNDTHESCLKHAEQVIKSRTRYTVLVSRDRDNMMWNPKFGSFLASPPASPTAERKFTEVDGLIQLDYQTLLSVFRASNTLAEIVEGINAKLAA